MISYSKICCYIYTCIIPSRQWQNASTLLYFSKNIFIR